MSLLYFADSKTTRFNWEQLRQYGITQGLISSELSGLFGSETLTDLADIIGKYTVYSTGAEFTADSTGDYVPTDLRCKIIKELIDKEARFLFSNTPDLRIESLDPDNKDSVTPNQDLLDEVLKRNRFSSNLVRAAKDFLIGKRIAITYNVNERGVLLSFVPSLEFIYETDPTDVNRITKFIQFYNIEASDQHDHQRIYRKRWWVAENGAVMFNEGIYDGSGTLIDEVYPDTVTRFTEIPAYVIVNEGLTGDVFGVSEVDALQDDEAIYSKLVSKDIDSQRKGMDQITVMMDVNPLTSKGLSRAAGALWDLTSDPAADGRQGNVFALENSMAYSTALNDTLLRIKTAMYSSLDVPNTSNEALQGVITSGKAMRAVYWGLITRCNEKMLDWKPAFEFVIEGVMSCARMYPEFMSVYNVDLAQLTDEYTILVESNYPILEDELEERSADLADVMANSMSRRSYMRKWYSMTEEEANNELNAIIEEQAMIANATSSMGGFPTETEILESGELETASTDDVNALLSSLDGLLADLGGE